MSATTSTQETISDAQHQNIVFERSGSYYSYLGKDGEGFHHHVGEHTNTVYVTQSRAERFLPENAGLYWFRVHGAVDHIEAFDQYDDRDIDQWIAYVESVRGWRDRPIDLQAVLDEVLTTGEHR